MKRLLGAQTGKKILLMAGMVAVLLVAAASVPGPWHHDGADQACAVCQVSQLPLLAALAAVLAAPIAAVGAAWPLLTVVPVNRLAVHSRPPRAPPV